MNKGANFLSRWDNRGAAEGKAREVLGRAIRLLRRLGYSDTAIAAELGIERRTVAHYCSRRKAWPKRKAKRAKVDTTASAPPVELVSDADQ